MVKSKRIIFKYKSGLTLAVRTRLRPKDSGGFAFIGSGLQGGLAYPAAAAGSSR